jgi:2-amino-4-hydroxy-6-hydroxymethyldihydropteridine diphosphokinase
MPRAYIGLGANLGEPDRQIEAALERLREARGVGVIACSRLYRSVPIGPPGQPDYCNAVCAVETSLAPLALLHLLQAIETAAGRVRSRERWGPRVLDLDLLHIEGVKLDGPELSLPHPHLHERNFVLMPLAEIAPDLVIEHIGVVRECADRLGWNGLTLWSSD